MLARLLWLFVLVAGCAADAFDDTAPLLSALVDSGSAEEVGLVAFLNDGSTTFELLDVDVALDRRAARNLIERRAVQPFSTVEEIDAVAFVGSVALQRLLSWALDHGWVLSASGDRDGAIIALVNDGHTDFALLDNDVGLDRRAARNIVDTRAGADGSLNTADDVTLSSIMELDAISFVGPSALGLLATYAIANGYAVVGNEPSLPCAIISEVIEGSGRHNKAIELYNCGNEPLLVDHIGVCLVQNDDTDCSVSRSAGSGTLAAGAVWVMCKTRAGIVGDPFAPLVDACQAEIGSAANFNGDDRIVLFHDLESDGALNQGDTLLDSFGDPATRPTGTIWAEHGFQRCDLEPFTSGVFDVDAHYTEHATTFSNLGVAPTPSCGSTAPLACEGERCLATEYCESGLHCFGIPTDGSSSYGRCVDPAPEPSEGEPCDRFRQCDDDLLCAGWTLWGEGHCVPAWMAGRWTDRVQRPIHDAPAGGLSPWIVVEGLASVPVDIEVVVHLEHARLTDLKVTLMDPNGDEAVLWNRSTELQPWSRSFVTTGISRDDQVNGRWSLRVQDMVTGESGVFHEWSLSIVSRWD